MQNTLSCSVRLILPTLMLTALSACGGGGGGSDSPTPDPVEVNTPPVLESIGAQAVEETEILNFTVTATDAESTPELSVEGLPAGATFNPANGTFNWQPAAGDAANSPYAVTFTATDEVDASLAATETIQITVTELPVVTADCTVGVISPIAGSLQASGDAGVQASTATLDVEATLSCTPEIPAGWGVKLTVAGAANGGAGEEIVTSAPFINTFTGLPKDEYTLTANVVDDSGTNVSGAATEVVVNSVGLGDYYIAIGDSITVGFGDDMGTDDISNDGRNSGGGYTPVLNDLLTDALGYPHTLIAVAVEGTTSEEGVLDVSGALAANPDAQRVLIKYGMNDAGPPYANSTPSGQGLSLGDAGYDGSFKDNIQQIIDAVIAVGKQPILAKINVARGDSADSGRYTNAEIAAGGGERNVNIRDYNVVIDELRAENGISVEAPDFYEFFLTTERYSRQYLDNIHPNGIGYANMADVWLDSLVPSASP